jgi:hypothetical protein
MWNGLKWLIGGRHFQRFRYAVHNAASGIGAAPQVRDKQHIPSGSCAVWHYGIGGQFKLNNPATNAERCNAVAVNERGQQGASRGNLNTWSFEIGFVCHRD